MAKTINYEKRLAEIAGIVFGELSDEDILHLLAERKQLQELEAQYDQLKQVQEETDRAEIEKANIEKDLVRLNTLISPDKPDEELIHLIEERKVLEAKMAAVENNITSLKNGEVSRTEAVPQADEAVKEEDAEVVPAEAVVVEPIQEESPAEVVVEAVAETAPVAERAVSIDQDFGREKIADLALDESSEFFPYLAELQNSGSALGRILDNLPIAAKKDKLFMLAVAKIDPAYAMHYADKNSLKKDEDFNIKVASLKNNQNSGSALAEMLPEARTAKVVMAAIKVDFRNVRFLLPQMEGYDDMLARAKNGALQKVKELKESADITVLIPKMLQKDKAFMKQVEEIVPPSNE